MIRTLQYTHFNGGVFSLLFFRSLTKPGREIPKRLHNTAIARCYYLGLLLGGSLNWHWHCRKEGDFFISIFCLTMTGKDLINITKGRSFFLAILKYR